MRVAPYVGAWIETKIQLDTCPKYVVAPYVGAWIETAQSITSAAPAKSHPTWVRGLKPFLYCLIKVSLSRTLRGCVD